jgi:Tfp pilus assembly protein PilF
VHGAPVEGSGRAYHAAGNSLMKIKRYGDASTVYGHAVRDTDYEKRGTVFANLGAALAAAGRREDAVSAYDAALADPGYQTPYKAMLGKAGALYDLGRYEEAAGAYREAAWADGNTDQGKALNNLGLCFMALGKPEEAVEPYRAALGVAGYAAKGKAASNLGLAYALMGFHEEAVREFEAARDTHGHPLSGAALAAYEASVAALRPDDGRGGRDATADAGRLADAASTTLPDGVSPWGEEDDAGEEPSEAVDDESRFFTMTEAEMRTEDMAARKAERVASRTPRAIAMRVGIVVGVILLIVGGISALVYFGFGFPTQESTVAAMLDAYRGGKPYAEFWVAVPQTDLKQEMRQLPAKFTSYQVGGVDRAALKSTARVVITLDTGSTLTYDVLLVREGVGWKVNGIKNTWDSTGG